MTITSTNHNPRNESRYARHRSIWKGRQNQLLQTVTRLKENTGITVHDYVGTIGTVTSGLKQDWEIVLHAGRLAPKPGQILGSWHVPEPSDRLLHTLPASLRSDLTLLWEDFITVAARRIGNSSGAGMTGDAGYHGECLVVLAMGPRSFDLIVSKYGYGLTQRYNHHFFQWQARAEGVEEVVSVDDYEGELELSL
jgi:hypothetical protein